MKHLKKFEKFNVEKEKQPIEVTADMNNFNDSEKWIKDFQTRKIAFETIYNTYIEDAQQSDSTPLDLYNKLVQGKFIKPTSAKSTIVFLNPLFTIYSEVCKKGRELKSNTQTLDQKKQDLLAKQKSITDNTGDRATAENDIKAINMDIQNRTKSLGNINSEINRLKKAAMDEINAKIKNLAASKSRITSLKTPPSA